MRDYRWKEIAIIFQGAMNALNPVRTVRDQIAEAITCHEIEDNKGKTGPAGERSARNGGNSSQPGKPIPVSIFGWDAAAGDDRHGIGLFALGCHRR